MRFITALLLAFCCVPALAQDADQALFAASNEAVEASKASQQDYLVLKTGEMLSGDIEMPKSASNARYVTLNGKRVELRKVMLLGIDSDEYGVAKHPGSGRIAVVEKSTAGRVSLFDEPQDGYASGVVYFQKDDGPIRVMNQPNLRATLSDNPESLGHLNRFDTYQKIGYGSAIAGAALVVTGAVLNFSDYSSSSPLTSSVAIAGTGIALATSVNLAVPLFKERAQRRAVRAYNR